MLAGAGSVKSSAGTYTACTDVMDPLSVEAIRSCSTPISVASVGWYPTADGIRPRRADTSEPACVKRKMLSTNNQDVAAFFITEVFRHRQCSQSNAGTSARRLIHLAKHKSRLVDHTGFGHLEVQVIALTGTLTNTGEYRVATVLLGDVVDELLDDHRLANTSTTEQTCLATLRERLDQVDHFDTGLEHLRLRGEVGELRAAR